MKYRSTVFWPEKNIGANQIVEAGAADMPTDDEMKARVAEGFAVEHVEPSDEPAGGAHADAPAAEPAKE